MPSDPDLGARLSLGHLKAGESLFASFPQEGQAGLRQVRDAWDCADGWTGRGLINKTKSRPAVKDPNQSIQRCICYAESFNVLRRILTALNWGQACPQKGDRK